MVHERLEDREVAQDLVHERVVEGVELGRQPVRRGRADARLDAAADGPEEALGEGLLVERQVAVAEEVLGLLALLDGVVVDLEQLAEAARGRRRGAERVQGADDLVGVLGRARSRRATPGLDIVPSVSTTRTEWWAVTARPFSLTMRGCGTPSASQTSRTA